MNAIHIENLRRLAILSTVERSMDLASSDVMDFLE
jgi:hypothetical protein